MVIGAAWPSRANDVVLEAFRRKEEKALSELASSNAWTKVLERSADILVKVPEDPFALGWAGVALVRLGYGETGAALMRTGASVVRAPVFTAELAKPTLTRDTTIVVRANATPLT